MAAQQTRVCAGKVPALPAHWQAVQIIRPDHTSYADIRPLVRLNVAIVVEQNGRMETGSRGQAGGLCSPVIWMMRSGRQK